MSAIRGDELTGAPFYPGIRRLPPPPVWLRGEFRHRGEYALTELLEPGLTFLYRDEKGRRGNEIIEWVLIRGKADVQRRNTVVIGF